MMVSPWLTSWPLGRTSAPAATRGKSEMGGYLRSASRTTRSTVASRPCLRSSKSGRRPPNAATSFSTALLIAGSSARWYMATVSVAALVRWPAAMMSLMSPHKSSSVSGSPSSSTVVRSTSRRLSTGASSPSSASSLRLRTHTDIPIRSISSYTVSSLRTFGYPTAERNLTSPTGYRMSSPISAEETLMASSSSSISGKDASCVSPTICLPSASHCSKSYLNATSAMMSIVRRSACS
mmetsp:Transcript_13920/g.45745  ORF Transcript_13920/g.45745 Transcript_13920/m.45745 type:complete len:237 (-) Transcript_13920:42-752(-)